MSADHSPADNSHRHLPATLAIDLGASGGRVIAGTLDGGNLTLSTVHRFKNNPVRLQDSMQWNVHGLWEEILIGLNQASHRFDQIRSVGVDSWGVDYALVDALGLLAGPVRHYRDARTRGIMDDAFETVPRDEIFAATGLQFMEINSLYQLIAAVRQGESSIQSAKSFLMIADFFHWLLTGVESIEATNASTTQLLDPRTRTWSADLMDQFGIPRQLFCQPIQPGTELGPVQPSVAVQTGLADVPVIAPATHDTASAVLAVPAESFAPAKPDWCYISSGTWSLMGCELPQPKIDAACSRFNFTNEGGVHGSTRLLKNIGGLWVFQQIRASMQRRGKEIAWDAMIEAARAARPFQLLINPDAPHFLAPTDMIDAIGKFANETGQAVPTADGVLFRASLEGLALRYREVLGMLEQIADCQIQTIHIVGGGSRNDLLCQMTADACNRTVLAGPVEATATGNVLMQLLGTGTLRSIDEARQLVRDSFSVRRYDPKSASAWDEPSAQFGNLVTNS